MLMMSARVSSRDKFCLRICPGPGAPAPLPGPPLHQRRQPDGAKPRRRVLIRAEFGCLSAGSSRVCRRRARLLDKEAPARPSGTL